MAHQQVPTDENLSHKLPNSNFSETEIKPDEDSPSPATAQPSLIAVPDRKDGQMKLDDWNSRIGEFSEVIDSEGHRVRINRY